jgi:hypothetical protein
LASDLKSKLDAADSCLLAREGSQALWHAGGPIRSSVAVMRPVRAESRKSQPRLLGEKRIEKTLYEEYWPLAQ